MGFYDDDDRYTRCEVCGGMTSYGDIRWINDVKVCENCRAYGKIPSKDFYRDPFEEKSGEAKQVMTESSTEVEAMAEAEK